ncbi:MAG: ArnT family glycosyltransferase [Planctomycetota bacterium]
MDRTEGRYFVMALEMHRSGDYVTPQFWERGEFTPFLGKPPLALWLEAGAFALFGVSEAAARLPSFLAGLAMIALVYALARRHYGAEVAWLAALIMTTSVLFQTLFCAVIMDVFAALCATGIVVSFARAGEPTRTPWRHFFFAWLGLGMLAKGPIVIVLSLGPILAWCLWQHEWRRLRELPWVTGSLLASAIFLPWYICAERANPGFLQYFFVHEHLGRFLLSDYGDRYGTGHEVPYGSICVYLLAALVPWTLLLSHKGFLASVRARGWPRGAELLMLLWGLAPVAFFIPSRNVLPTYLLPGLGGLAIWLARALVAAIEERRLRAPGLALVAAPQLSILVAAIVALIWFRASAVWVGAAVVVAACSVRYIVVAVRRDSCALLFASSALAMAAGLLFAWPAFGLIVERDNSTRAAMQLALDQLGDSRGQVIVTFRGYDSMGYYGQDRLQFVAGLEPHVLEPALTNATRDVYIIKESSIVVLSADVRARIERVGRVGRLCVYREVAGP